MTALLTQVQLILEVQVSLMFKVTQMLNDPSDSGDSNDPSIQATRTSDLGDSDDPSATRTIRGIQAIGRDLGDSNDPSDSSDSNDPSDSSDPNDPSDSSDPNDPGDLGDPNDPSDPGDSNNPSDSSDPNESAPSDNSTDPIDPDNPVSQGDDLIGVRYPALIDSVATADLLVAQPQIPPGTTLPDGGRFIGDVNGDDLVDVSVFMEPPGGDQFSSDQDQFAVVLFGTPDGSLPELDALNGNNGFIITDVAGVITDAGLFGGLIGLGDLNGDGMDEMAFATSGFLELSRWKVLKGTASAPATRTAEEITESELLIDVEAAGISLQGVGDINGDGLDDVLFGLDNGKPGRLIYGETNLSVISEEPLPAGRILSACQGSRCDGDAIGDFDGDGFDDLLVSRFSCGFSNYASILYGSANGIAENATQAEYPDNERTRIVTEAGGSCSTGSFTGIIGDVDGDGRTDLLFTAPSSTPESDDPFDTSIGHLLFGPREQRPTRLSLDELDGALGVLLADPDGITIEDADGDGFDDILFPNDQMFTGRPRDASSASGPVVVRDPTDFIVFWETPAPAGIQRYRLSINGTIAIELDASAGFVDYPDLTDGDEATLVLEGLTGDGGDVVNSRTRIVPAYPDSESLIVTRIAPRLVELTFNGDPLIENFSNYLVWRDGTPIGRSINGADNYIDDTVVLGVNHNYFITPDYLATDPTGFTAPLDTQVLESSPLLQRRSNSVVLQ